MPFQCIARIVTVLGVCATALLAVASSAAATDRFFPDLEAASPSGQFRLKATSPDNAQGTRPFARNFTYILADTMHEQTLWTRRQPEREGSPIAAWVHDSGWTAVWTGRDELLVFSPTSAQPTGTLNILDEFSRAERRKHVHMTTAGPMWAQGSRWYFLKFEDQLHFVVRAWWGRRIIVHATSGRRIADEGKMREAVQAAERLHVIEVLRTAAEKGEPIDPETGEADWRSAAEVVTAARIAGRDCIEEAIPFLRDVERWTYIGSSTVSAANLFAPFPEGEVDPFGYRQFTVRQAAQTALRRLGAEPAGLPATQFDRFHDDFTKRRPVVVNIAGDRRDHVDRIKKGMSALDVLRTIDAPDAVPTARGRHVWEYDIDAEEPFTLRIFWTQAAPPVVDRIERITPPRWKDGDARDDR